MESVKTNFKNLADLKKNLKVGQLITVTNYYKGYEGYENDPRLVLKVASTNLITIDRYGRVIRLDYPQAKTSTFVENKLLISAQDKNYQFEDSDVALIINFNSGIILELHKFLLPVAEDAGVLLLRGLLEISSDFNSISIKAINIKNNLYFTLTYTRNNKQGSFIPPILEPLGKKGKRGDFTLEYRLEGYMKNHYKNPVQSNESFASELKRYVQRVIFNHSVGQALENIQKEIKNSPFTG